MKASKPITHMGWDSSYEGGKQRVWSYLML